MCVNGGHCTSPPFFYPCWGLGGGGGSMTGVWREKVNLFCTPHPHHHHHHHTVFFVYPGKTIKKVYKISVQFNFLKGILTVCVWPNKYDIYSSYVHAKWDYDYRAGIKLHIFLLSFISLSISLPDYPFTPCLPLTLCLPFNCCVSLPPCLHVSLSS